MKVKFWGVRGSVPTPGPKTMKYGGNTTCIEVKAGDKIIILDSGTGIRELGNELAKSEDPLTIHLLITHTHWDHINGWPFFDPAYQKKNVIYIYGSPHKNRTLQEIFSAQMNYYFFPVQQTQMAAQISFLEKKEETFNIDDVLVSTKYTNHPVPNLGYRIEWNGKSLFFTGDHEPFSLAGGMLDQRDRLLVEFIKGVNLLICDSTYTPDEYEKHIGWGHSSTDHCLKMGCDARTSKVVLTHHEPDHTDEDMDKIAEYAKNRLPDFCVDSPEILVAREQMELEI